MDRQEEGRSAERARRRQELGKDRFKARQSHKAVHGATLSKLRQELTGVAIANHGRNGVEMMRAARKKVRE